VWHYDNPTWLYPLFKTKRDKPLNKPLRVARVVLEREARVEIPSERAEDRGRYGRNIRRIPSAAAMIASVGSVGKNPVSTTPA
jgi:hypothetical protein